jgi:purine-binding chemotaxis protein CheW
MNIPTSPSPLVLFSLDDRRYGLALSAVERVERVVEITPLPHAPAVVLGVINLHGRIIPVVDPRQRFGLPERHVELTDQLVIARTTRRTVAIMVDAVGDVLEYTGEQTGLLHDMPAGMQEVLGVLAMREGLAVIHDLDRFLSLDEDQALDEALERA